MVAFLSERITAAARCCSPYRSSRPITGRTIHTMAMIRLSLNALPKVEITSAGPIPAISPVTIAEAVTTSIGFSLRAKPATTSAIPISGQ